MKMDRESGPPESCLCLGYCGVSGQYGQRGRACVDYGMHVKVSGLGLRSVSYGWVIAEGDSWYTAR